jgi:hypothetical protein
MFRFGTYKQLSVIFRNDTCRTAKSAEIYFAHMRESPNIITGSEMQSYL